MKLPRVPAHPLDQPSLAKVLPVIARADVASFVAKANTAYYHWEELRHRAPPEGLSPEDAWTAVKLSRSVRKTLPLLDTKNRPFHYWLPEQVYEVLHLVDRQGGGTLATEVGHPNAFDEMRDRVLIDSLMEEAIATSQIEGAVTTRKVAKELLRSGRKPRGKSEQMIVNGYRTVRLLRDRLDRPMTIELLNEIQESMTSDTLDDPRDGGRFRTPDDRVEIIDTRDNETVFTPPPAELLNDRIGRLIDFANAAAAPGGGDRFVHPLVRAAVLHFWLAYEHPYVDGNGRTARAIFYWSMLKSGYWLFEFLTISRIILAAPMRYYRSFLYTETDDNDLTYFLTFKFDVTKRALADLHKRLAEVRDQQQRVSALRLTGNLNTRQRAMLDHALRNPSQVYTIESHQRSHGVSYDTARYDLLSMLDRGLVVEVGGRRPRQFMPAQNLKRKIGLK